ncbi:MAG TPA: DUF4184 family protein [Bacteroidales bacterium]|nr:DUF4184 family protein [Bacteroidales bacterium]
MAFPLAHPALVLPLTHLSPRYLSATGLIIGSLAPDLAYLGGPGVASACSSWDAGLWCWLPAGLGLSYGFHAWARDTLIRHMPRFLQRRFIIFSGFNWARHARGHFPAVLISLLIGILSHLGWDALDLTHDHGHVYRSLYAWSLPLDLGYWQLPLIRALQHAPSVLGMAYIGFFIHRMPSTPAGENG